MLVNGCDCYIVIKTSHCETDLPYSEETLREAFSLLQEEAAIEGGGECKAIRKNCGVTGCVVTPLTIGTAPLLLYLAMGSVGKNNRYGTSGGVGVSRLDFICPHCYRAFCPGLLVTAVFNSKRRTNFEVCY